MKRLILRFRVWTTPLGWSIELLIKKILCDSIQCFVCTGYCYLFMTRVVASLCHLESYKILISKQVYYIDVGNTKPKNEIAVSKQTAKSKNVQCYAQQGKQRIRGFININRI